MYLTSFDYSNLEGPYECSIIKIVPVKKKLWSKDLLLLVRISPTISSGIGIGKELLYLRSHYGNKKIDKMILPMDVDVFLPEDSENPECISNVTNMVGLGIGILTNASLDEIKKDITH